MQASIHRIHRAQPKPGNIALPLQASSTPLPRYGLQLSSLAPTRCTPLQAANSELFEWIRFQGGYVHPGLVVSSDTRSGSRGIVASTLIEANVLFEIPLHLRITLAAAQIQVQPFLTVADFADYRQLQSEQQLALFLAHARNKGDSTLWHPYISSLPQRICCGWNYEEGELRELWERQLKGHGLDLDWWQFFVNQARSEVQSQAMQLATRYGRQLEVSVTDTMWGLGQVLSRKVITENQVVLEPLSDLLNCSDDSAAVRVEWSYTVSERASRATDGAFTMVSRAALPAGVKALQAGQELFSSYGVPGYSQQHGHLAPLTFFLLYGFVPSELWCVDMRTSRQLREGLHGEHAHDNGQAGLWDYLTLQYQADAMEVLEATSGSAQQALLSKLLTPLEQPLSGAELSRHTEQLDRLMLAAIDTVGVH